jgi:hypothetical protein
MDGPDGHLGNDGDGSPTAGLTALAVGKRRPALVALASLLFVLMLSQSSPADSGGSAGGASAERASARMASFAATAQASPELALVTPAKEESGGRFGASVALSADGDTALVGAPKEGGGAGAAWVFTHSVSMASPPENDWENKGEELEIPAAESKPGDCSDEATEEEAEEECRFGIGVALSADGDLAAIGAPHAYNNRGAVWIFARSDQSSRWSLAAELTDPEEEVDDRFGRSVAVSADGSTVLVGAPMWRGRAWVFTRSSPTEWAPEVTPLTRGAGGVAGEGEFGQSVALSADGDTALIGAPGSPGAGGGAWVFQRSSSGWSAGNALKGEGQSPAGRFGISVALSADGATALVGARMNDEGMGAAWAFVPTSEGWSEQGPMLTGLGEAEEEFGSSVALSADGDSALIGAPHGEGVHGTALLFERSAEEWGTAREQLQPESSITHARLQFGSSVALSSDAETKLVGGRTYERRGAAWVFGKYPSVDGLQPDKGSSAGGTTVTIAGENLSEVRSVKFGEIEAASFTVTSNKSIVAVSPPGTGVVQVSVEAPLGVSAANIPADQFTYLVKEEAPGGGGSKEEAPGGGGSKGGGGGNGGNGGNNNNGAGDEGKSTGQEEPASQISSPGQTPKSGVLNFGPFAGGACGASLVGKRFSINGHGRALVKLRGMGAGKCAGKLTLRIKVAQAKIAGKKIVKLRSIGTASFAIVAGQTRAVSIKLNAAGRRLLKADHGHLNTSLLIVKSSPAPVRARSASIRLTQLKPTKPGAKKT